MRVKIYQVLIDTDTWDSQVSDTDYVGSVLSRCATWGQRGSNYMSSPLMSLSFAADEIRHALKGIKHEILDITEDYDFFATTAPTNYDYGYVIQIADLAPLPHAKERLVAIPKESAEYQVARYHSGLRATRPIK